VFTTVADNQGAVEVHVLQGERDLVQFNRSLARFELVGISPAPRGVPQIEVSFDIDANGIVSVSARDKISGKEQAVRITPSTGLSKDEIDRMMFEARQFAESDRKVKEAAELRNRIQTHTSTIVKSFAEFGWLLEAPTQESIKTAIQKARAITPGETDTASLRDLLANLEDGASRLTSAMYNLPGGADPKAGAKADAGVSEADIQRLMKSALDDTDKSKA
jgi:molecular chaperone DnaK